jgi:hypothetical protein
MEILKSLLKKWQIEEEKIHAFVHDSGANIKKAIGCSRFTSIKCTLHLLQLVVKDCLNPLENFIKKIRDIVHHFCKSIPSCNKLYEAENKLNIPRKKLIIENTTRWNSMFMMCQKLNELKSAVILILPEINYNVELTENDWETLSQIISLLNPIFIVTKELEKEKSGLSSVLPMIMSLKSFYIKKISCEIEKKEIESCRKILLDSIDSIITRFEFIEDHPAYLISTILEPRFNKKSILENKMFQKAKKLLYDEYYDLNEILSENKKEEEIKDQVVVKEDNNVYDFWNHIEAKISSNIKGKIQIKDVVDSFLKDSLGYNKFSDELVYWKAKEKEYPVLAQLTRNYLGIPLSSSASERLFSESGNIVTEKRNRLNPEKVNMLVFLNKNLK